MTDEELRKIPYGEIPMSMYRSGLDPISWGKKFIKRSYKLHKRKFPSDKEYYQAYDEEKEKWNRAEELYLNRMKRFVWESDEALVLMPRRYGKTEGMIELFAQWYCEEYLPLYIVTPSVKHGVGLLYRLLTVLKSPQIRRYYGDIVGDSSRSQDMQHIAYPDSFEWDMMEYPLYMTTFAKGKEGWGPSWIHFEDVMQKSARSEEVVANVEDTFTKTFENQRTVVRGQVTKFTITATRYGVEDFYHYLMNTHEVPLFHIKCMEEDNKTWSYNPNHTLEKLLERKKKNVWAFETNMNNNPLPRGGNRLKAEWFQKIPPFDYVDANTYMSVDFSYGLTSSDYFCLLIGIVYKYRLYIVDAVVKKNLTIDQQIDFVIQKAREHNTASNYLETNFIQIQYATKASKYIPNVTGVHQKGKKEERIDAALPTAYSEDKILYFENCPYLDIMERQHLEFNAKKPKAGVHDDCPDCLTTMWMQLRWKLYPIKKIAMKR